MKIVLSTYGVGGYNNSSPLILDFPLKSNGSLNRILHDIIY